MKKIYLAGFDVFYSDAVERGEKMKEICKKYGFKGLYPLDNEASNVGEIFNGNVALIDQCDIIVANLNDFRGIEMDCGTAFEIGYAYAKGKDIYGYIDNLTDMVSKIGKKDKDGFVVEDFDMPVNLMIGYCAKIIKGDFDNCIKSIK